MQQLKCFASVDYIAEAGPGLVLGYALTQWEFAPVGDLGATGATGVLREHARHLCECLVQGYLDYPVLRMLKFATAYNCCEDCDFTDIGADVGGGMGWLLTPNRFAAPRSIGIAAKLSRWRSELNDLRGNVLKLGLD